MSRLAPLSATLLVLFLAGAILPAAELEPERIAVDAEALIAIGDRSPGSAGAKAAADLIAERLTSLGLEPTWLRTTVTSTIDYGSTLDVGGQSIALVPHRPNRAAAATTGGEAITGPVMVLGRGRPEDFQGKNLRGAIVVLDGDSADAWTEAAQLGAVAVVFRHPERIDRWNLGRQGMPASLDFPRFVAPTLPDGIDGQTGRLVADARLEPVTAWSVCARIAGTGRHSEAVLVSTGYESPAGLAMISPGATAAWNAATLLEAARALAAAPTTRDVVVIFHGGAHEHFRGLRHLIGALTQDLGDDGYDSRGQVGELQTTQRLLSWRGAALKSAFATAAGGDEISLTSLRDLVTTALVEPPVEGVILSDQLTLAHKETEQFIALLSGRRADERQPGLERLRLAFTPTKRRAMSEEERTAHQASIDAAESVYQRYRTIQQKLDYEQPLDPSEDEVISELVQEGVVELDRHLAIVDRYRDDFESLAAVRSVLAGSKPIHLIGLDLSDGNDRFAAAVKGSYVSWVEELGWLTSGLVKLAEDLNQQAGTVPVAFERAAHDAQDEVDAWFGADYLHDAGIGGLYLPGATLSTVADARLRQGGPQDDAKSFESTRFLHQVQGLGGFLTAYIDAPFIANRRPKSIRSKAPTVETEVRSIGSKTGFRGFPYPLVLVHRDKTKDWSAGIGWEETYWGNAFGKVRIPFVTERHPTLHGGTPVSIYGLDGHGRITAALASGGTMKTKGVIGFTKDQVTDLLPLVFMSERSRIFGVFDPRLMIPLSTISVLSATRDSAPNFFHVENASNHAAAAVFTEPGVPLRITATQGQVGNRMILTGHAALERAGTDAEDTKALAAGIAPGNLSDLTALDSAEDIFRLNDERLAMLRRNGINPDSLVSLHSLSERHLESAREALDKRDYETATGEGQTAWALAGRVYPSVLSTANDIVYGLVVMLLFAIPFAWICERLFISGSTIARKVAGFIGFFVVVFLFFFFFHPAFQLATTPMVIFLAFVILIMSTWVIGLLYNRFEFEMEQIRMSGMGMHKADVSRLGTLFATVGLGISNMRRRPMRTFLTALTVVLMTFILLTFASFNPNVGSQRLGLDAAPPYTGILVRQNGWVELAPQVQGRIRRATADSFDLHPTRWLAPGATQPKFPLSGPGGMADVAGIIGITAGDPSGVPEALLRGSGADAPRGFADDADWLFLPRDVMSRLGADIGDEVRLRGVPFKVGMIDQTRLSSLTVLGGDPVTPLAYDPSDKTRQDETSRLAALAGDGAPPEETGSAIHLSPAAVAIGSAEALERLGAGLHALALTPKDRAVNVPVEAEELAREIAATLRVGTAGESYLLTSVGRMSVAGLGAVLIPLILGGLIIFSTMLNSVAERGKEIFIFSSLGLAPIHVAALFLVEASIYAVLGGLGGYMLAQLIISTLGFLADLGYGVRPDINYSSFTAVATILLVMATVLLSALYPALLASKAANPGTVDFKVPDPDGDRLEIAFPFTVAARDVRGLCAFLARYFDSHTEAAGGCFTAADARMKGEGTRFEVTSKIWLAPFDLGISQQFLMTCRPTDVRAIYSVHLTLDLLSGQRSAWKRTNLAFLKDLRQQFLVWRTLAPETMDQYRADGGDEDARQRLVARAAAEAAAAPATADSAADSAKQPATGGVA